MINLVAGCKPWNRRIYDETISKFPGEWHYASSPLGLITLVRAFGKCKIHYIFFLHWSWKVSSRIVESCKCVCFHMTDVPFGRGGSPLQNLIARGHRSTKLTALRMVREMDAGPIYLKRDLSLEGDAEEIYIRAGNMSAQMIQYIMEQEPGPYLQVGQPTIFERRKPQDSRIPSLKGLQALHDFIRMLDAETYPRAFLELGGFRFEFSHAALRDGRVEANVRIATL